MFFAAFRLGLLDHASLFNFYLSLILHVIAYDTSNNDNSTSYDRCNKNSFAHIGFLPSASIITFASSNLVYKTDNSIFLRLNSLMLAIILLPVGTLISALRIL